MWWSIVGRQDDDGGGCDVGMEWMIRFVKFVMMMMQIDEADVVE